MRQSQRERFAKKRRGKDTSEKCQRNMEKKLERKYKEREINNKRRERGQREEEKRKEMR